MNVSCDWCDWQGKEGVVHYCKGAKKNIQIGDSEEWPADAWGHEDQADKPFGYDVKPVIAYLVAKGWSHAEAETTLLTILKEGRIEQALAAYQAGNYVTLDGLRKRLRPDV